jgi:hypothetical protein
LHLVRATRAGAIRGLVFLSPEPVVLLIRRRNMVCIWARVKGFRRKRAALAAKISEQSIKSRSAVSTITGNTFQPSLCLHMTDEIETLEMRHIHVEYRRRKIGISVKNSVGFTAIKGRNHLIAVII